MGVFHIFQIVQMIPNIRKVPHIENETNTRDYVKPTKAAESSKTN